MENNSTIQKPTIQDIISAAGGGMAIAKKSPASNKLTYSAIMKWTNKGIPDRHWPILIRLAKTNPNELFEANQAARRKAKAKETRLKNKIT